MDKIRDGRVTLHKSFLIGLYETDLFPVDFTSIATRSQNQRANVCAPSSPLLPTICHTNDRVRRLIHILASILHVHNSTTDYSGFILYFNDQNQDTRFYFWIVSQSSEHSHELMFIPLACKRMSHKEKFLKKEQKILHFENGFYFSFCMQRQRNYFNYTYSFIIIYYYLIFSNRT